MSHVASVEIEIKDLKSLQKACEEVGLEFRENQKTYKWYGRWMNDYSGVNAAYKAGVDPKTYGKCVHAIGVPGNKQAYEIGVVEKEGGGYGLVWDFWNGGYGLEKVAGKDCGNLVKSYAVQVAKRQMLQKGYTYGGMKTKADGTIEMVFNSY